MELTNDKNKQLAILSFIYNYISKNNFPPTVREICDGIGLSSTATVHGHLLRLEKKGWIVRNAAKPRAIEITQLGNKKLNLDSKSIPLVKNIRSKKPYFAKSDIIDQFPMLPNLQNYDNQLLIWQYPDTSLNELQIMNNDMLIIHLKNQEININDIIVYANSFDKIKLAKLDHHFKSKHIKILGTVVGIYRNLTN
ncbi:MAG: transcriptional regulator [Lactobacillus iners]|nr:transcriptional regulator [Lactobacillus iners]MCT7779021.1 transcriptional regulator [Lactobacillus iners]MCT7847238.1 transcriptional regulator [Lactobacillus iners]MCT7874242.1 transcriptional regulator [Lactobacillus iners]MCT7876838.1 transcriptional regulator [Lactobacillus iners]